MTTFTQAERDKLAASGAAMSDGSFPIRNRQDLLNAIHAIGRADESRRPAVKAHIRKRAKALGLTSLLPDDWRGRESSPKDVASTERLMKYWAEGPGAAKIGWGTPGDFRRCELELGKYVSPNIVAGLCANLHHRATGAWPGHEHEHKH